ncbi:MAG TPA: proteasome accessory factor PafA2 family protein [Candidatus Margulisiibacteriota bacterium]|nr:proteasome accessory factor PafA2 family protein [Candidatus Margulisiibacteriota bacterium]
MGRTLPKLCGADIELGNFILGVERPEGSGAEAARAVLREIVGLPCTGVSVASSAAVAPYDPQDWGRKYLPANGGCVYIDLDHVEACIPEVTGAYDHLAAWHAMLRIVRRALGAANARRPAGQRIQVLVNNSDGRSNSYGSHLNFLVTRRAWDNLFNRRLHYQLFLAAFQASSIVLTGQGKVGAENGMPPCAYQIAQRADFFQTLCGLQTTYNRPLVNSRDEPLCGRGDERHAPAARLHCIFFDNTLCHVASLLKVGLMQIVLTMIEAEQVNPQLLLEDPVDAVQRWSHDPSLRTRAQMAGGSAVTAVELQLHFLDAAKRFVAAGGCDGSVPQVRAIVQLWEDTLLKLEARDLPALAGRLDWVLKLHILQRAMQQRPQLTWASPEIKLLDHLYSSLDPADGLYWAYEASGVVESLVSDERITYFEHNPPADTRAWTRAMLLRLVGADAIESVDWDSIVFRAGQVGYRRTYRRLDLASPLAFAEAETGHILQRGRCCDTMLDELGATAPAPRDAPAQFIYPYAATPVWPI